MNLRRHEGLYRLTSAAAILGIVLPVFAAIFAPLPARAQGQAPMQVGVVEFRNDSGVQGELLARFATDAVVLEMSKSDRFDVVTRVQLETQMKQLGLRPPLSSVEVSRLGEALAAQAMIEGAVKAVEVRGTGAGRQALVTLVVRMLDQASGEVINGAVQTGYSNARVGYAPDDDKLIAEAIDNAAYLAVKTMIDYIIPEVTVLNTIRTNEVMLNKGARDGMRVGLRMIVTREAEIIGQLQVKQVQPDYSTAVIINAMRGIRPEDKARAVFEMPAVEVVRADPSSRQGSPSGVTKKRSLLSGLKNVLLPLAVVLVVKSMFTREGENVGAVSAEAGLSGYNLPVESGTPGVRIKWNPRKLGRGLNVKEYHIWRENLPGPAIVVKPPLITEGEAFDDANGRDVAYLTADPQTHKEVPGTTTVPALTLGRPYRYYVSAYYVVQSAGGDLFYESPRESTGQATPLAQIQQTELRLPLSGSQQNLHKVTFEWLSRRGADTYIVEASIDPLFRNPEFVSDPVPFSPIQNGQPVRIEISEKLYTVFRNVSSDREIWWRVGARSSGDSPGPIPPPGRPNMRYVYSESSRFYPIEMPPGQP